MLATRRASLVLAFSLLAPAVGVAQWSAAELAKLTASDPDQNDNLGSAVATCGDTVVIGAPSKDHSGFLGAGAAYVYQRSGDDWLEQVKLVAGAPGGSQTFGAAVAISGDTIFVGVPQDSELGPFAGSTYVFERDQGGPGAWGETAKLLKPGGAGADRFGSAVAVFEDTAVIGSPTVITGTGVPGAVSVFERSPGSGVWSFVTELTASDGTGNDKFGTSVAISGDTILVGASWADHPGRPDSGSAYFFHRDLGGPNAWGEAAKVIALPPINWAFVLFGSSVALHNDLAVIGAPDEDFAGVNSSGAAYVVTRTQGVWNAPIKIAAEQPYLQGAFGGSVSVFGESVLVGADIQDLEGAAFLFTPAAQGGGAWVQTELVASDGLVGDRFGSAVALSATTALIGARLYDISSTGDVGGLACDPSTGILYGTDVDQGLLITIDRSTGQGLPIGPLGFDDVQGLAFDPGAGVLYGSNENTKELISIDPATGAGTAIGTHGFANVIGLAFDPTANTLYASRTGSAGVPKLATIDVSTAVGTNVGALGVAINSLAWDPQSGVLFGASESTDDLYSIDTSTGAASLIGPVSNVRGMAFDQNTSVLAGTSNAALVTIDVATGAATIVGVHSKSNTGSAYVFGLSAPSIGYCTAGTSASGCQATLSTVGVASATAPSEFDLVATGGEGGKDGLFFFGTSGPQANAWGNGTSLQCVAPPLQRAGLLQGMGTSGACDGSFSQDLNALWCSACPKPAANPGAGATVQAQLWYRDPLNTSNQTTSLSDAIEFCVLP